jgi:hypothetical protein
MLQGARRVAGAMLAAYKTRPHRSLSLFGQGPPRAFQPCAGDWPRIGPVTCPLRLVRGLFPDGSRQVRRPAPRVGAGGPVGPAVPRGGLPASRRRGSPTPPPPTCTRGRRRQEARARRGPSVSRRGSATCPVEVSDVTLQSVAYCGRCPARPGRSPALALVRAHAEQHACVAFHLRHLARIDQIGRESGLRVFTRRRTLVRLRGRAPDFQSAAADFSEFSPALATERSLLAEVRRPE